MRIIVPLLCAVVLLTSCETSRMGYMPDYYGAGDSLIVQSLFNDRAATISEDNIQKILDGSYRLPQKLRVAMVRLEPASTSRRAYWSYGSDEQYLKTQQSYLDGFSEKFRESPRVVSVAQIPDLLVSRTPSFTSIREAAVRLQADVVVVYSITSDLYSKYKFFSRPDIKAFATTQLIVLDVRTGLIPFSAVVTRDVLSQRKPGELDNAEASSRIQQEAALLTIREIGNRLGKWMGEVINDK